MFAAPPRPGRGPPSVFCTLPPRGSRNGGLWNIDRGSASVRLDVEGPDDLAPLFAVVSDELAEIGGRAAKHRASLLDKPRLDNRIGDSGGDLPVELFNDLGGRASWRTHSIPCTRLIARYEFAHGWDVRQCLQADRRGHCQGSYLARADVLNRCAYAGEKTCTCPPSKSVIAEPPPR